MSGLFQLEKPRNRRCETTAWRDSALTRSQRVYEVSVICTQGRSYLTTEIPEVEYVGALIAGLPFYGVQHTLNGYEGSEERLER